MDATTTKLRKTFRYPTDDSTDDLLPSAMDEEEQETLIRILHEENTTRNKQYAFVLFLIPIVCILPYIPTFFAHHTAFFSLLSISSLLSTAYIVHTLPPELTSIPILDAWSAPKGKIAELRQGEGRRKRRGGEGPLEQYLPYMNSGLCVVLGLLSMVGRTRTEVWWGFGWLPGLVWAVVLVAKVVMGSVDPEAELGGLRYEFKGA